MPLFINSIQAELSLEKDNVKGAGDTIGIAITKYLNTMFPVVAGPLKDQLDINFINTLNSATDLNPLTVVLPIALDVYKLGLLPIISVQNPGVVAIPPPSSIFITPILSLPQTKESFISSFSAAVDSWFRTGTYTVPGGPVITWS
jgi:hypothetical protein